MKKNKRIVLLVILLLTTGCTGEYNLTIDNNTYSEEITIVENNGNEVSKLKNAWKIPVDKYDYQEISGGDTSSIVDSDIKKYNYKLVNNKLTFDYKFSQDEIINSTAISQCYDKAAVQIYQNSIVISTSNKVKCFDNNPTLTNLKINIITDKKVNSHNADSVSGKKYTWVVNKNNSNSKPVNMVIENSNDKTSSISANTTTSFSNKKESTNNKKDYTAYIFCGILLIVILVGYSIFKNLGKEDIE